MLARDYPLTAICQVLGLPRSSWYYEARGAAETELKAAINEIAAQFPTYGSRRVMHQLRRMPAPGTTSRAAARVAPDARARLGPAA